MAKTETSTGTNSWTYIHIFFGILFLVIGILNAIIINPLFGIFYALLSLIYFPFSARFIKERSGIRFPNWLKLLIALLILWGTLAVSDLMEYMEANYL